MSGFLDLNINQEVTKALGKVGITEPTKIQTSTIPSILENLDIIAQSETGSGKTLAYLLPLIEKVEYEKRENQFIILAPTHELGVQVNNVIQSIKDNSGLNLTSTVIIGNVNIKRQVEALREKPQFVIGSPGRILELIKLKKISAHTVKTVVIDECDRLLDENNIDTVKAVIKTTLKQRQILMFSATISQEVVEIGNTIMKDPKVIKEDENVKVSENIDHVFMVCDRRDKILLLRKIMAALKPMKAIAFINKTDEIEILSSKLKFHGLRADGIHGSFVKNERKKVMDDFKSGKINLMVASDLAARGLDIEGVSHIINIDIPDEPKDYLHRTGRTGRANNKGIAISIVTDEEVPKIKKIENQFNIKIDYVELSHGKVMDARYIPNVTHESPKVETREKSSFENKNNKSEGNMDKFRNNKTNNATESFRKSTNENGGFKGNKSNNKPSFKPKNKQK